MTIVEISNVSFANKGDELMVCALLDQLRARMPHARVAVPLKSTSVEQRRSHDLLQVLRLPYVANWGMGWRSKAAGAVLSAAKSVLPRRILSSRGVVDQRASSILFDVGGFAYGDPWGWERAEYMARWYGSFASEGRDIVLLPKTFGPFADRRIGESSAKLIRTAKVAFARDAQSQRNLAEFGIAPEMIPVFPDYTLPVVANATTAGPYAGRACLIPNMRMLDKTSASESGAYVGLMSALYRMLAGRNLSPFLLLMQHAADGPVAAEMERTIGRPLEIVKERDPRKIKGIIGAASVVVSSRLHGCICALGQAVPCIATGWNHKYQELYRDFDSPELMISSLKDIEGARRLLEQLLDERMSIVSERLRRRSDLLKTKNAEMWELVFKGLDTSSAPALAAA